jgi:hypothetical protein
LGDVGELILAQGVGETSLVPHRDLDIFERLAATEVGYGATEVGENWQKVDIVYDTTTGRNVYRVRVVLIVLPRRR